MKLNVILYSSLGHITKLALSYLLILGLPSSIAGQAKIHQSKIDSIQKLIDESSDLAAHAEWNIEQAALYYYQNHLTEQTEYLEYALINARESGNDSLIVECLLQLGVHRNYDNAFKEKTPIWCDEASQISSKINSKLLIVKSQFCNFRHLQVTDLQSAFDKALQIESQISEHEDNILSSKFYHFLGSAELRLNKINEANEYYLKALSLLKGEEGRAADEMRVVLYTSLSRSYMGYNTDFDKAYLYIDSAFQLVQIIENVPLENTVRLARELKFLNQGEYKLAQDNRRQMIINNGSKYLTAGDYSFFGYLFSQMKDYKSAIENFELCYKRFIDAELYRNSVVVTGYLMPCYIQVSQFEKGKSHLQDLSKYIGFVKDSVLLSQYYRFSAQLYEADKDYQSAIDFYKKEILTQKFIDNPKNYKTTIVAIANAYLAFGQIDSSNHYIDLVYEEIDQTGNRSLFKEANLTKYKIYRASNDFEKSLNYLEKASEIEALLYEERLKLDLEDERVNLKVEQSKEKIREAEDLQRLAESEVQLLSQQKKLYLVLAGLLASLLLIGAYVFRRLRNSKKLIEDQKGHLESLNQTKDKFFGIIAHDLRSPIVALQSVRGQMEDYIAKDDKEKLKKLAGSVEKTSNHLSSLLDNLLNWALLQQGVIPYNPIPLNLKEAVDQVASLYSETASLKGVSLNNNLENDLFTFGDEAALSTILRNLISNSIKYSSNGDEILISGKSSEDEINLSISDTGVGMDEQTLQNIFSLKKKSMKGTGGEKGTGLGLNIVKELVALNKGSLDIDSQVGKGTSVKLLLPLAKKRA